MDKELLENLVKELNKKIGPQSCPACHHGDWGMAEGIFINLLFDPKTPQISSKQLQIQSIVCICNYCGYMRQFAAKAILPNWEELTMPSRKK